MEVRREFKWTGPDVARGANSPESTSASPAQTSHPPAVATSPAAPSDRVTLGDSTPSVSVEQAARLLFGKAGVTPGGQVMWRTHIEAADDPGNYIPVLLPDQTVIVNGQTGTHAFHPDGSPAWHLNTGNVAYRPPALASDGTMYMSSRDGQVYAVRGDAHGARILWHKAVGKRGSSAAPVIDAKGRLIIADDDGRLHMWNADGTEAAHMDWQYLMSEEPTLLPNGRLVLEGYSGVCAVLNPDAHRMLLFTGPRIEQVYHGEACRPTCIAPDGTVYDVSDGRHVRALEPDGQTLRWSYTLSQADTAVHVTLRPEGTVYVLSGNDRLTALDPHGQKQWEWTPDQPLSWDYTIDEDGTAYFTPDGPNRTVFALGLDGRQKWATELSSRSEYPVLGPQGTLLVGGDMSPLRVLDRKTGELLYEENLELAFGGKPFVALEDGTIVAATEKGDLERICFKTKADWDWIGKALKQTQATAPEKPPAEIRLSEDYVIIDGVRVPRRPSTEPVKPTQSTLVP